MSRPQSVLRPVEPRRGRWAAAVLTVAAMPVLVVSNLSGAVGDGSSADATDVANLVAEPSPDGAAGFGLTIDDPDEPGRPGLRIIHYSDGEGIQIVGSLPPEGDPSAVADPPADDPALDDPALDNAAVDSTAADDTAGPDGTDDVEVGSQPAPNAPRTATGPQATAPPTTAPPTTAPPTTAPPTTAPPTTAPPTTAAPRPTTTVPPTSAAPTTAPPTTAPPQTAPPTTAPPTTAAPTTAPPTTAPPTTAPPTTAPPTTVPPTTAAPEPATATIWGQPYNDEWPSLDMWDRLSLCESGGNWAINTGNGYYGGIQFSPSSWGWVGGEGLPSEASREEQIYRGNLLWERQGWNGWPGCKRHFGWSRWQTSQ